MSRRNRKHKSAANALVPVTHTSEAAPSAQAFSFGDPVPVLDRREILDYLECWKMGKWYEPPISPSGLARAFRSAPHHSSAIYVKRNILAGTFVPHPKLSRRDFAAWALDYLVFGNGYLERLPAVSGKSLRFEHAIAKYMRRGVDNLDQYWMVRTGQDDHEFKSGQVFHLMEPDINQEIYGVPEYLSALQSALLNEAATLFRRKYYLNGSHAGFILYMTDPAQEQGDIDKLRDALKNAKGPGNFRNLFMYSPNGKKDGMQLLPIGEVAAKDEFTGIKTASRDDILAAHRVPPQLLGIVPNATSGFGDVIKAAQVSAANELQPLQSRFSELNEWAGEPIVTFGPYTIVEESSAA
jgi:PBSX family phage portal protein